MATPEEERRKRSLLEQALASLQGAGEGAARIGKNTYGSIANAIGGGVSDVAGRFGQTAEAAPPMRAASIKEEAPDFSSVSSGASQLGSAVSEPPPTQPRKPALNPTALSGGRTTSEMWGLPGAEPVDLEGGDSVVNKLKPETIQAYAETPSTDISSDRGLGERGGLSFAVGDNPAAAGQGLVGPNTPPQLGGGDLVDSWNEVKTAQKELGSFSDSAGKWWSVLLAAMFPQYGSALNMIGGMKESKYRAARDKYDTAFKVQNRPRQQIEVDGGIWDIEKQQFAPGAERRPRQLADAVKDVYADTPDGVVVKQVKAGESYDPYYRTKGAPYQGPTPQGAPIEANAEGEKYPYYSEGLYGKKLVQDETNERNDQNWKEREKAEQVRQENRKVIRGMIRQTSLDVAKARADLQNFAGKAAEAAADLLGDDINAMTASTSERAKMMRDETIRIAAELKAIQMRQSGTSPGAAAPAAQAPAPQGSKGRVLTPFAPAPK